MTTEDEGRPPPGRWTHSHEEDEGDVRVYRPADTFDFPPTRAGRETLVFGPDGRLVIETPGPDDRPQGQASLWLAMEGGRLGLGGMPGSPEEVVEVVESSPDVLRLRARGR